MIQRKARRKRTVQFHFMADEQEAALIRERMERVGVSSFGAYMRKMAIDGYFINLDLTDVRELVSLLRRTTNNLNQIAKRTNETRSIYEADIQDLQANYDLLWEKASGILKELSRI